MTGNHWRQAAWACAAVLAFGALPQSAHAQVTAAQQSAIRANCRSDFMSHCSGVTPGGKDALVCLQKNVESLSPGCQTAVRATLPPPTEAAAPPPPAAPAAAPKTAPIVSAPPPPAMPAAPAPRQPAAVAAPSPPPPPAQAALPPPPAAHAPPPPPPAAHAPVAAAQSELRAHCGRDFVAHCPSVRPGGPDALACLQRHVGALSPACRKVVSATMAAPPAGRPVAVAPAAPPPPPAAAGIQRPVPRGSLLVAKACARYLVMHCRGIEPGSGRAIACLTDYVNAGHFVGPRCRTVLNMTSRLR